MPRRRLATIVLLGSVALLATAGACSSFSGTDAPATAEAGADAPGADGAPPDGATDAVGDRPDAPKTYYGTVLAAKPLAYWRMSTKTGVVSDETGNKHDLALQGGAGGYVLGVPGALSGDSDTAIRFDGKSGNAKALAARAFDFPSGAPFSIELWAKRDALDGGSYFQHLVSHSEGSAGDRTGYLLYLLPVSVPPAPSPYTSFEVDALAGKESSVNAGVVPAGQWAHYAAVHDAAGMLRLYIDGTASAAVTVKGPLTVKTADLVIGAGAGGDYFAGTIDEVAIYDRALTFAEIVEHKMLGRP